MFVRFYQSQQTIREFAPSEEFESFKNADLEERVESLSKVPTIIVDDKESEPVVKRIRAGKVEKNNKLSDYINSILAGNLTFQQINARRLTLAAHMQQYNFPSNNLSTLPFEYLLIAIKEDISLHHGIIEQEQMIEYLQQNNISDLYKFYYEALESGRLKDVLNDIQ